MFWVTRYPMLFKIELGWVSKEISGSGSGLGTRWALFFMMNDELMNEFLK